MSHSPPLFFFMLRIRVFSLTTLSSSLLLSALKFSRSSPLASTQAAVWFLSPPILLIRFSLDNLRKRAPLSSSPLHHSLCHPNHRIHLLATSDLWHQRLAGRITIESGSGFVPGSRGSRKGSLMKFKLWAWGAIDIWRPYFLSPQSQCVEIKKPWAKLHRGMLLHSVNAQWWWETMGGLSENQGFLKDSNIFASAVNYRSIFSCWWQPVS